MTSRPSTTLISCRGAEKRLCSQLTFGRSTNSTRFFVETKLPSAPGFKTIIYLDRVLYHSLHNEYIENSQNAAFGSHGISKLTKTKFSSIAKVKTSFYSLFRVEKMVQWCRLFVSTRSACGNEKRSAEPQGHQFHCPHFWVQRSASIFGTKCVVRQYLKTAHSDYRVG